MPNFSTPRGTQDILPQEWPYWNFVLSQAEDVARRFGYRRIETPTFGETSLFSRTSGAGSDVVAKEMYTFRDRDDRDLTLRPEGTAPVMRAYLQYGMSRQPQPVKLYYIERMYRYDKPQAGRFREHHQFGCEAIGVEDAYVDVEMISLLVEFHQQLGLRDIALHINTIGDQNCRPRFVRDLVQYLRGHESSLAERDRERLETNPLRVLDSKETSTQPILASAPNMVDYLCETCRVHWDKLLHGLGLLGIAYEIDPRLVRGLDYYTRTVFEFIPSSRAGAQSTIDAGGRYDALSEAMGGPPIFGVGFGAGIERLIISVKENASEITDNQALDAYVVHSGAGTEDTALLLANQMRQQGLSADMAFGQASLKSQMRRAGAAEARFAAIIGEDEAAANSVTLRDLATHAQQTVECDAVAEIVMESGSASKS